MSSSSFAADVNITLLPGPPLVSVAVPGVAEETIVLEVGWRLPRSVSARVCLSLGERAATPQQLNRLASDSATDRQTRPARLRGSNFILTLCYACSNIRLALWQHVLARSRPHALPSQPSTPTPSTFPLTSGAGTPVRPA